MSIEGNVAAKTLRGKITTSTGDMSASVYDTEGKARDIFGYVDEEIEKALNSIDDLAQVQEQVDEAVTTAKTAQSTARTAQTTATEAKATATEAKTTAGSALEIAEAAQKTANSNEMELIANITLTSAQQTVSVSTDTNGDAFALKEVLMIVKPYQPAVPEYSALDILVRIKTGALSYLAGETKSSGRRYYHNLIYRGKKLPDSWLFEGYSRFRNNANDADAEIVNHTPLFYENPDYYLSEFIIEHLSTTGSSTALPANTVIKVYGVRA